MTSDSGLVIQGAEAQAVISPETSVGRQKVTINPGQGYPVLSVGGNLSDGGEMYLSGPHINFDVTPQEMYLSTPYINFDVKPQKIYYYGVDGVASDSYHLFEISGSTSGVFTLQTDRDGLNIRWGSNDAYQIWLRGDYLDIRCNGQSLISMHTSGTFSIGVGTSQLRYDGINLTFGGKKILMED